MLVAAYEGRTLQEQVAVCAELFQNQQYEAVLATANALLQQHPDAGHAWKLKGAALFMLNRDPLHAMRRAAALLPDDAEAHNSLGAALQEAGQMEQAALCYRRAADLEPDFCEAYLNLGAVMRSLARHTEAAEAYRLALAVSPNFTPAMCSLGIELLELKQLDEAETVCRKAIDLEPDRAALHNNLGTVLQARGDIDGAAKSFLRAIEIDADDADANSNWGALLIDQDRPAEAVARCQKAIESKPEHAAAHNNLGTALKTLGKLDVALESYLQAILLNPQYVEAHRNAGLVLHDMGRAEACRSHMDRCLALEPDNAATRYAQALMDLQNGNLSSGWANYEFRWTGGTTPVERLTLPLPMWNGESLGGKTIFIWGEQGIGDQVLFASMLADVAQRCARCVVACTDKLLPLLARSFPNIEFLPLSGLATDALWRHADYQCPMGSLAQWLRPTMESFYAHGPFLRPEPQSLEAWRLRLNQLGDRPKVGICWRSANLKGERQLQFATLDQWGPILSTPGVDFVNLQIGDCGAELDHAASTFKARIHRFADLDLRDDLDNTAALMGALDLVIGNTTATGRLAAALGVETWALRYGPSDWTNLGTDHNPWLPSFRYFSKAWKQSWEEVIDSVAQALPEAFH